MVASVIKTYLKIKNKSWMTIEKIILTCGKTLSDKRLIQKVLGSSFILMRNHKFSFYMQIF